MKFEKLNLDKFQETVIQKPEFIFGGADTKKGSKTVGAGTADCQEMSWTSDTSDGSSTTYHGSSFANDA